MPDEKARDTCAEVSSMVDIYVLLGRWLLRLSCPQCTGAAVC